MTDLLPMVTHEFASHRSLGERAILSLDDERFFERPAPSVNSVALIVKHLAGNLRARWADPFGGDGEPPTRNRDGEFELTPDDSRAALMQAWSAGWGMLEATLASLSTDDLERTITIRDEPHTVAQALLRAATHAAYHVGQILYVVRMLAPDAPYLTVAPKALRRSEPAVHADPNTDPSVGTYLAPPPHTAGVVEPRRTDRNAPPRRVGRILETALYVDDVPRAVRFYTHVIGLRVMSQDHRMAALDAGCATVLLLFQRGASLRGIDTEGGHIPPHDGAGPVHVAFSIEADDLERWCGRLERYAVDIESVLDWPRGGRSIYFRDPDGHSVEFATPGVWEVY